VDVQKEERRRQRTSEREKHRKATDGQENWKAQQKREVAKGTSGEHSKC